MLPGLRHLVVVDHCPHYSQAFYKRMMVALQKKCRYKKGGTGGRLLRYKRLTKQYTPGPAPGRTARGAQQAAALHKGAKQSIQQSRMHERSEAGSSGVWRRSLVAANKHTLNIVYTSAAIKQVCLICLQHVKYRKRMCTPPAGTPAGPVTKEGAGTKGR